MVAVTTERDFSVVFDAYSQFEETVLSVKMKNMDYDDEQGFWFKDENDVDMLLDRYEHLIHRSSELVNNVQLRQNPHNVRACVRVRIFQGNPTKQILTYAEAARTVDPFKAVGKPHTLWVAFAKLYETHGDVSNARAIFDKAVQVDYNAVDHLANVWCEWAEMELGHKKFKTAHNLMKRATYEPSAQIKWRAEMYGITKTREIFEQAINGSELADEDVKVMCLRYTQVEENLGEIDRGRALYKHASQFADPRFDHEVWNKWGEFEMVHGNEDTATVYASFRLDTGDQDLIETIDLVECARSRLDQECINYSAGRLVAERGKLNPTDESIVIFFSFLLNSGDKFEHVKVTKYPEAGMGVPEVKHYKTAMIEQLPDVSMLLRLHY
ncbi:hypothetical protein SASPL_119514 [Salvia splendens]|uniref:Pre-mRNA-splicing factor SYF1 n=1 Tax=Salvia splendens TaxID=180675 RepID=A0A8X8XMZ7_SALSN|nr:hypothetical protein SASPL_119514 [Salvia splendens]